MAKSNRTPNDQRSTVKNPKSYEFNLDIRNRANQAKAGSVIEPSQNGTLYLKDGELYFRGIFI